MTLSDVRKFRNKEKEMRIEDLTEYAYTVSEKTLNNSGEKSIIYELDAPITDYENTYMKIWFEIKDDKIKMQVLQLIYRNEADGKTTAFSINYNPMPIDSFFENNDKYTGWNYFDITFEDELPSGDYIIEVKTDGKNKFTKDLSFTTE